MRWARLGTTPSPGFRRAGARSCTSPVRLTAWGVPRWFKHMHDRDGGSFRHLDGGGFNASGQGVGCLAGREGECRYLRGFLAASRRHVARPVTHRVSKRLLTDSNTRITINILSNTPRRRSQSGAVAATRWPRRTAPHIQLMRSRTSSSFPAAINWRSRRYCWRASRRTRFALAE